MEKIGIVGVGRMGANMARRLKECGYEVASVYDVDNARAQTPVRDTAERVITYSSAGGAACHDRPVTSP